MGIDAVVWAQDHAPVGDPVSAAGLYGVSELVLGNLAATWANHPDYQKEWTP